MTDENNYTDAAGVRYVAEVAKGMCIGCAHDDDNAYCNSGCRAAAPCVARDRADKRSIIWVKAE
jgi:hypothetical protein